MASRWPNSNDVTDHLRSAAQVSLSSLRRQSPDYTNIFRVCCPGGYGSRVPVSIHTTSRATQRARYDTATADLDPPVAIVDRAAFDANAAALVARAAGKPVRVASKSVRCRDLLRRALDRPGWAGVMAYALAEAIWLVRTGVTGDALVAYPTADRGALATLAADESLAAAVTLMVDDVAQLDLVDDVVAPGRRPAIRLCIDLDASWRPLRGVHLGVRRSPVHSADAAGALAAAIAGRR